MIAKSKIPDILQTYKEELLEDWMREQLADDAQRPDLLAQSELGQQAAKFLDALGQAAQSDNLTNVMAPQWRQVRDILTDICRTRAQQNFSSSETAKFLFSLKPPLFRRLRQEFGENPDTVADENWAATVLLDELGLFTTEVYQKYREEVIVRQQQELLEQEALRRGGEWYRALYEDSPSMYFTVDTHGTILSVNRFGAQQLGYAAEELVGRTVLDVFHEEDREGVLQLLGTRLREPKRNDFWEGRKVRKDGSILWVRENVRVVQNPEGDTVILLACEDITERKRAEEQLAYHAGLLDNVRDAVHATDERLVLTAWNRGAEEMYGWAASEVLGRNVREVVSSPLTDEQRAEALRELAGTGRHRAELTTYRKDGTPVYVEGITVALRDDRGQITGYLSINRDITERKRAEQELRKQEELFRSLSACSPVGVFLTDLQGRCTYTNPRCQAICGFTFEEALGEGWARFVHLEDRERVFEEWSEYARGGHEYSGEFRFWPPHQDARWTHVRSSPLFSDEGELVGHVGTVEDITERKRAEEALQESNNRIEDIFERITDGFFALDHEWRLVYLNSEVEYVVQRKREELLGKNMWEEFPETEGSTFYREFHRAARERITVKFEEYYPPLETWFEVHAYPSEEGLSVYFRNVTERKRAEKEAETRTHQQALVAELGLRALAETDLLILMDDAVATLAQIIGAEYCKVLELLPDGETLLLRGGVGWKGGLVGSATMGTGLDSQAGYTLLSNEPVIVEDLRTESRFSGPPLLHEHEVVSSLTVVIHSWDRPFGVLGVHTKSRRAFTEDDVNFVQAVANVLGTAVERKQAEEKLDEVREAERQRMARDLHDEALQDLTCALAEAQLVQKLSENPELVNRLERLAGTLKQAGQGLRGAIYDLRLEERDRDQPFAELLEYLVDLNRQRSPETEIELSIEEGFASPLSKTAEAELLRIVREALINARRHSESHLIQITVGASGRKLWAEVSDDGRGFDPAKAAAGMGTKGMRERARALGGELRIMSKPGEGSRVRFELALQGDEEGSEEEVRILLVEDHTSFRQGVASVLGQKLGFAVVGQAGSLSEAREMLSRGVDVAIVDLGLPDGYGGELIKELRETNPQAQALVLSASLDRPAIARAVESGAAGVLHKSVGISQIAEGVRRLRKGETLLPLEEIVELLRFASSRREEEYKARRAIARLTPRETEVLQALAEGLDTKEIAERLYLSVKTARNHLSSILAKLEVHSQLQALVFALRYGVIDIS